MKELQQNDFLDDDLELLIKNFDVIEQQRLSLNEQIASVLNDVDIMEMF